MPRIARSLLFVPGDRPERFDKAAASGAHGIVLDLEDAVAPQAKSQARGHVADWLREQHRAIVRVNAVDTIWFADDLRMVASAPYASVMLPKADAASLAHVARGLPGRRLIGLIETVGGYLGLQAAVGVQGVTRLAFGSVDFAAESGIADEGDAMTAIRTQVVLWSCQARLEAPLDGVGLEFHNEAVMREDALRARRLGFGGKLCIHPRQVGAVNAAFLPSQEERDWAARVIAAFEASAGGAVSLDGKMIDKPVVERARRILADAALHIAAPAS